MTRHTTVPVIDGDHFLGLIALDDLASVPRTEWPVTKVGEVLAPHQPRAKASWTIEQAVRAMDDADLDVLGVVDDQDRFVGLVTTADLVRLDEILGRTEDDR